MIVNVGWIYTFLSHMWWYNIATKDDWNKIKRKYDNYVVK